ncbi:MAG: hypothetical protein R3D80_03270 [Paracoccaceae bacterium]
MTAELAERIDAPAWRAMPPGSVQALWSWLPESWRKPADFRDAMTAAFDAAGATGDVDALITHVYPWLELEAIRRIGSRATPRSWTTSRRSMRSLVAGATAVSEWEVCSARAMRWSC